MRRGFTVIELLVVLTAMAVLLSIATPRYLAHLDHAKEQALRHNLSALRLALEQYRSDKGQAPASLDALVQAKYLRDVPLDPITERRDTWLLVQAGDGAAQAGVVDVRSGAPGTARDGRPYGSW
jgi:general secretion pathway protein G